MWCAKESVSIEKLANGKYVFEIQPTVRIWIIIIFQSAMMVVDS